MDSVHSYLVKTDITAVKIFEEKYLLAGIGQALYVYRIADNRLIHKSNIFQGQRVHGLVSDSNNKNNVAIFGGKQINVSNIQIQESEEEGINCLMGYKLNKYFKLKDWIITSIWIKNSTQLAILTAHNVLMICDLNSGCIQETQCICEEKCILYSGSLLEVDSEVVVFGGTAFSQVVVWSTHSERVYHRLTGHKGVIFSVSYNKEKNIIITTSDDRSLRIWNVVNDGDSIQGLGYWKECDINLKVTLFAHSARVMQHQCVGDYIISIGEDTMLCIWSLCGDLISKRKVCPSGVLWCVDCSLDKRIIITGGGDSGITILPLVFDENINSPRTLQFVDESFSAKRIVLTARGNIVCITEQGNVLYYNFQNGVWNIIHKLISNAKSYLSISLCKQFVAVGNINGHLDIFIESCKNEATLSHYVSQNLTIQGKIFSMHWVYDRHLVVCDESGVITIWGPQGNDVCIQTMLFQLPKSKQRWLTAAALDPRHKQLLIVGNRCGNLYMFKKGNQDALQSFNKIHGNIGINMIEFHDDKVITVGRNGLIKIMILNSYNGDTRLCHMYNIKAPFDWIEKLVDKDRNIICGFKETSLIVWDKKTYSNIVDINCGGGHRSWDLLKSWLQLDNNFYENVLRFVYVKNSEVKLVDIKYDDVASKRISSCFHSKEVNFLQIIPITEPGVDSWYFLSAGEDTVVNISICKVYNRKQTTLENVLNFSNHLSSIRCMCLVKHNSHRGNIDQWEYYLYTGGGRAQLCVTKMQLTNKSNNINCYDLANYLLKGTDLERKQKDGSWCRVQTDADVETRFMTIDCVASNEIANEFVDIVLTGCSDGLLRIYRVVYSDHNKCNFILDCTIDYHKKCILIVRTFKVINKIIGVSLSVDGTIAIWDFTCYTDSSTNQLGFEPIFTKRIHKAGINACDFMTIEGNRVALATGGDDNSFHINILQFANNNDVLQVNCVSEWSYDKYHCSQITGVVFCRNDLILIASIDQRVTAVRWSLSDGEKCEFVTQYCSSIPDVQGLHLLDDNGEEIRFCVFGKGLEIIGLRIGRE